MMKSVPYGQGPAALREAHSGSTVRNQAGPVGSESSMGDITGLGKKERGRRRRNKKRAVRKAFKVVAGADLRKEVEILSEKVATQSRILAAVRACLLHEGDERGAVCYWGDFSCNDEGNLEREHNL